MDIVTKAELIEFGEILKDFLPRFEVTKLFNCMNARTCRLKRKNGDQNLKAQICEAKKNNNELEQKLNEARLLLKESQEKLEDADN